VVRISSEVAVPFFETLLNPSPLQIHMLIFVAAAVIVGLVLLLLVSKPSRRMQDIITRNQQRFDAGDLV
jgi:hypothetical protein